MRGVIAMRHGKTFAYSPTERTDDLRAVVAQINAYRQRLGSGADPSELAQLADAIRFSLDEFDRAKANGHSNPEWVIRSVKADAASVLKGLDQAIEFETDALKYAKTREEKAKSHNNLSEYYRQAGRYAEAVGHSKHA